ncbi:hypothetical protein [Paraliomyxa miuraensis]|uniref:hypothetical protein n=1 Tax=Paraliomyxa miuraensis TaxID=376150 RepID=UPI002250BC40|nr:hypothetical protein [Paraliomyxa miuraensis]MCX4244172.1 hypothetical protein [Paraliomyxa miuraensis]
MAPPLPLANVAGTLALSFTAGRAAPASEPPIQRPTVPAPPSQPTTQPPGEPEAGEPTTPEPPSDAATPEPPSDTATAEPPSDDATPEFTETTPPPGPTVSAPIGRAALEDPFEPTSYDPPVASPRLLRPNGRQFMFNLFVGGSRALRGYSYYGGSEFKAEAEVGGFDQRFRVGGFGVLQVNSSFPFNTFTFAPRLSLNRQIIPNFAFYFTTNLTLGYRLWASVFEYSGPSYDAGGYGYYDYDQGNDTSRYFYHSAVLGVSWGASAIIAERLLLSFRPLDLELVIPAPMFIQTNWSVMGGVGILWGSSSSEKRRTSRRSSRRRRG